MATENLLKQLSDEYTVFYEFGTVEEPKKEEELTLDEAISSSELEGYTADDLISVLEAKVNEVKEVPLYTVQGLQVITDIQQISKYLLEEILKGIQHGKLI